MSKVLGSKVAKLGEYGEASVAIDSKAVVSVKMEAKVDLIAEVKKLAAMTKTTLDDKSVAQLEMLVNMADSVASEG